MFFKHFSAFCGHFCIYEKDVFIDSAVELGYVGDGAGGPIDYSVLEC